MKKGLVITAALCCLATSMALSSSNTLLYPFEPKASVMPSAFWEELAINGSSARTPTDPPTKRKRRKAVKREVQDRLTFMVGNCQFDMIYVAGGSYQQGQEEGFTHTGYTDETPIHRVDLYGFYIGRYEVTQQLWETVMGYNPSNFVGEELPVEQVSYNEVQQFIKKLNEYTGLTFRLPTEAEWEYAARGGCETKGYDKPGGNDVMKIGWSQINSQGQTHPVGELVPNELGIYDMSGNVWEWCSDWYRATEYLWLLTDGLDRPDYVNDDERLKSWFAEKSRYLSDFDYDKPLLNPQGPDTGECRVGRGGSWSDEDKNLRVTYRNFWTPDKQLSNLGFRLALSSEDHNLLADMPDQYVIDSIVGDSIYVSKATQVAKNRQQGIMEGVFSVGAKKKVRFSKGNLQYNAVVNQWRFADHQNDFIGQPNTKYAKDYPGWIDLFAWGTSGYRDKTPFYQSGNSRYYGNGKKKNIDGTSYDWGVYNRISNGGEREGMWRTLSVYEWDYLFRMRPDAWLLHGQATIDSVQGIVLLPDDWLARGLDTLKYNTVYLFTSEEWEVLERAGAVFLPAAGTVRFNYYVAGVPQEREIAIEGYNTGYGTQVPMTHYSVKRSAPYPEPDEQIKAYTQLDEAGSPTTTEMLMTHPLEPVTQDVEREYYMRYKYRPAREGNNMIGYYWTTIHYDEVSAMAVGFAIGLHAHIMPVERLTHCSVRLVQDVE